jgi:hypothetical protein
MKRIKDFMVPEGMIEEFTGIQPHAKKLQVVSKTKCMRMVKSFTIKIHLIGITGKVCPI